MKFIFTPWIMLELEVWIALSSSTSHLIWNPQKKSIFSKNIFFFLFTTFCQEIIPNIEIVEDLSGHLSRLKDKAFMSIGIQSYKNKFCSKMTKVVLL